MEGGGGFIGVGISRLSLVARELGMYTRQCCLSLQFSRHPEKLWLLHALVCSLLWLGRNLTNIDSLPYLKAVSSLIRVGSQTSELLQGNPLAERVCVKVMLVETLLSTRDM